MPEKQTDDFAELVAALNRNKVEFVIVGAHAVAFHGYARGTKDLDILIRSTVRFKTLDDLPLDVIGQAVARLPAKTIIARYDAAAKTASRESSPSLRR